jgi:hypothetical protein
MAPSVGWIAALYLLYVNVILPSAEGLEAQEALLGGCKLAYQSKKHTEDEGGSHSQTWRLNIHMHSLEDHNPGQHQTKTGDPIQNITKARKAGVVTKVVDLLPSKCKALSSNPSTGKKNVNKAKTIKWGKAQYLQYWCWDKLNIHRQRIKLGSSPHNVQKFTKNWSKT